MLSLTRQDLDYLDFDVKYEEFLKEDMWFLMEMILPCSFRIELEVAFKIKAALLEYSVRIKCSYLNKLSNMKNEEINELLKNKHVFPMNLVDRLVGRVT